MQPVPLIPRLGVLAALAVLTACNHPDAGDAEATAAPQDAPSPATIPSSAHVATSASASPTAASLLDRYAREATELAAALDARADTDLLRSRTEGLIDLAAEIVPAFVDRHPHCVPYLEAALQVRERWPQLDHEAIERDYHHDGALPKIDNAGFCYHMKDLITHPATVLVLLSQAEPDHVQAKSEIDEVIAHMDVVRGQF